MMTEYEGANLFLNIPVKVAHDNRLKDKDKLLYGEIYAMLNVTNSFFMSNSKLAERLNCSEPTIKRSLARLEEYGYLKRYYKQSDGGKLDGYEWILNDSPATGKSAKNSIESNEIPATGKPGDRDNRQPENPPLSNNNLRSINLSSNKGKELRSTKKHSRGSD